MVLRQDRAPGNCENPEQHEGERRKRCSHAEDAADSAVRKTFAILGVDIDKPAEVKDFQESLRFGDKLRKAADKGVTVFVVVLVTSMAAAMWLGLVEKIRSAP